MESLVDIVGEIGIYILDEERGSKSDAREGQGRQIHDLHSMRIRVFCGQGQSIEDSVICSRHCQQGRFSAIGDSHEQVWKATSG